MLGSGEPFQLIIHERLGFPCLSRPPNSRVRGLLWERWLSTLVVDDNSLKRCLSPRLLPGEPACSPPRFPLQGCHPGSRCQLIHYSNCPSEESLALRSHTHTDRAGPNRIVWGEPQISPSLQQPLASFTHCHSASVTHFLHRKCQGVLTQGKR